jgi:Cys-tRNA(Pro) deacylase
MDWPEAVERVAESLRVSAIEARVEEFSQPTGTAAEAASAVGCEPAQIVKTVVFVCDGNAVLALVPGDRRADPAKVARAAGRAEARVATADEVRAATGFEPGGVAPFGSRTPLPVFLERSLLAHELVWIGAGSPRHVAVIGPRDLLRVARAEQADLVR